jgi:hypothetical protein
VHAARCGVITRSDSEGHFNLFLCCGPDEHVPDVQASPAALHCVLCRRV